MVVKLLLFILVAAAPAASAGAAENLAAVTAPVVVPNARRSDTHSCRQGPQPTPRSALPASLKPSSDKHLIGKGSLWTVPIGVPEYQAGRGVWTRVKLPWFRLSPGQLTVTARRVDGGTGTFNADIPPVEAYPLGLNPSIGPGFIPSNLEFSTGGCWKVTARLADSQLVLYVDIDDSREAICAQLAADLGTAHAHADQLGPERVRTITSDQQSRHCEA